MATWTAPADVATNDVETAAAWNLLLGTSGSLAYLKAGGGGTMAYKSATQVFTTNTTYADVTASSGNLAFAIAASEVWVSEFFIPLSFGGTGGAKFQLTGPAAPTAVSINSTHTSSTYGETIQIAQTIVHRGSTVTAFSSNILAMNSAANTGTVFDSSLAGYVHILAFVQNGANAGTVTLQAAQNSSNSTTTLGIGSHMVARRLA